MWPAIAQLATLGLELLKRVWPKPKDEPTAHPTDIATAQGSGAAASRAGKEAARRTQERAAGYQPLPGPDAVRPPPKKP